MLQKKRYVLITVVGLIGLAAFIFGLFISQHLRLNKRFDASQFHGTVLEKPREINAFALTGMDHSSFNNSSLQGHWTMVFFGFTHCGSICPTTMAELGKMYKLLEEQRIKKLPQIVLVSLDPERDSLDKLDHYVKAFNPHFYAATGDERSLEQMTKEWGIAVTKQGENIEHTGTVIVFNPQGELTAFFTMPHRASLLAEDYQLLVS